MGKKRRVFSESVKRDNVRQIELGRKTQSEVAKLYGVSRSAVNKWVNKYGKLPKNEKIVIESSSDYSMLKVREKEIAELERTLGKMHMELTYLREVIKQASIQYSEDIEKKFGRQ
jgi:transposase-like protein